MAVLLALLNYDNFNCLSPFLLLASAMIKQLTGCFILRLESELRRKTCEKYYLNDITLKYTMTAICARCSLNLIYNYISFLYGIASLPNIISHNALMPTMKTEQ